MPSRSDGAVKQSWSICLSFCQGWCANSFLAVFWRSGFQNRWIHSFYCIAGHFAGTQVWFKVLKANCMLKSRRWLAECRGVCLSGNVHSKIHLELLAKCNEQEICIVLIVLSLLVFSSFSSLVLSHQLVEGLVWSIAIIELTVLTVFR